MMSNFSNNNTYQRYSARFSKTESANKCKKCNEKFKEGDIIYHKAGRRRKTYHENCWKSLLN